MIQTRRFTRQEVSETVSRDTHRVPSFGGDFCGWGQQRNRGIWAAACHLRIIQNSDDISLTRGHRMTSSPVVIDHQAQVTSLARISASFLVLPLSFLSHVCLVLQYWRMVRKFPSVLSSTLAGWNLTTPPGRLVSASTSATLTPI
jgi:hypothetical protein